MKSKIVRYTLDTLPRASEEERAALRELVSRPGYEPDTSEIPVMTDEQWENAIRGGHYRPIKKQVTARVDADVLAWLKAQGKGYQSRINAILRREMLAAMSAQATK